MNYFTFLVFLFPLCSFAQTLPELIARYESECNQMVKDTVLQHGVVTYETVPVLGTNGKILHYTLGTADTVWQKLECPEFKFPIESATWSSSGVWNVSSGGQTYQELPTLTTGKVTVDASRKCACDVKLREVEPWSRHFWEWVKNSTE